MSGQRKVQGEPETFCCFLKPVGTLRWWGGCGREAGAGLKRVQQAKQDNLSVQNKNMQCVLTVTRKNVCVHGGI